MADLGAVAGVFAVNCVWGKITGRAICLDFQVGITVIWISSTFTYIAIFRLTA